MIQVLAALLVLLMPGGSTVATPSPETYKQNEQGLEKQFEAFLKAYQRGNDKGMDEGFAVFRMPKEKEWFEEHFSAEDAAKLSAAYEQKLSEAENVVIEDMDHSDPGSRFHARCESLGEGPGGQGSAGGYGFRPLKPVVVEQFKLEFQSVSHGQKFTFIANFVYVDGAYRFVGGGGAPFWAKPEASR